jgi:hypothetical protein
MARLLLAARNLATDRIRLGLIARRHRPVQDRGDGLEFLEGAAAKEVRSA